MLFNELSLFLIDKFYLRTYPEGPSVHMWSCPEVLGLHDTMRFGYSGLNNKIKKEI